MKHLIFLLGIILAFAFSLAGCRSHSVVTKTNSTTDSVVVHNIQQHSVATTNDSSYTATHIVARDSTYVSIIKIDYDTSKSIDSLTGKPPILSTTYINYTNKADKNTAVESTQKSNNTTLTATQDSTNISVKKVASSDSKSVSTSFPWRVLLISIAGIALLAAGIEIKRRFFK